MVDALRPLVIVVAPEAAGQRLDRLLVARVAGLGRRRARQLFRSGAVVVNGRRAAPGDPARAGDTVTVGPVEPDEATADSDAPLHVRLERTDLVVVDKPAGQPTAPRSGADRGTVANALLSRYPEMRGVGHGPREPGLLHRLDTFTSGLLLAARSAASFERLHTALRDGAIEKRYLAVVDAEPPDDHGSIVLPLVQHPTDPRRVIPCDEPHAARAARAATTHWRLVRRHGRHVLLELRVDRAFRHQIRVHLASLHCPIVGDYRYGGTPHSALGDRHALHASRLAWAGDGTVPGFQVESDLPTELVRVLVD